MNPNSTLWLQRFTTLEAGAWIWKGQKYVQKWNLINNLTDSVETSTNQSCIVKYGNIKKNVPNTSHMGFHCTDETM